MSREISRVVTMDWNLDSYYFRLPRTVLDTVQSAPLVSAELRWTNSNISLRKAALVHSVRGQPVRSPTSLIVPVATIGGCSQGFVEDVPAFSI